MSEPLRVHSLHALAYCERLFYLEEVENLRVADAAVYAGRRLHVELKREEDEEEWVQLNLESERWGLIGQVDCVRRRDGAIIPYEHKRGRSARSSEDVPETWPSDRLQIIAYAALVAEHLGHPVLEGRVRYHADNAVIRVPIDETANLDLVKAIARARELQSTVERPPVTTNERLCVRCSLAPVCLPEEARLGEALTHDLPVKPAPLVRLFPVDDDRQSLHVMTHGAYVGRKGDRLEIRARDQEPQLHPVHEIGQVVLHGFSQITTQALRLCAQQEVGVHWITEGGRYTGGFVAGTASVQRRIRQYKAMTDPELCLRLARQLADTRVRAQLSILLRAGRDSGRSSSPLKEAATAIRKLLTPLSQAQSLDSLRGYEGSIGAHYFGALPDLIVSEAGPAMRPDGRSRRPPRDRCNALLSFGYALLLKDVCNAIVTVGLDPCLGFYHQPRSQAQPLALDLMELFRVPLVDLPVIGSINRRQWDQEEDFKIAGEQVWLSDAGRRKLINIYERRKTDKWKHPVIGASLSYARLMELEVRLLEKEWMGEGGLFGRSRLR